MPRPHPCTWVGAAAALLAGCGSQAVAELPPPARPAPSPPLTAEPAGQVQPGTLGAGKSRGRLRATADGGRLRAVLDPRARTLTVSGARSGTVPAGTGPSAVVSQADRFYVVDSVGEGLLVVQTRPEPRVTRRVALLGRPFAAAADPERRELYVALRGTNELVVLPAHGRPFVRARLPTVRGPREVLAGGGPSGGVLVRGQDATQVLSAADLDGEQQR